MDLFRRTSERAMDKYYLTVTCKSKHGIVAAVAGYLAESGCNFIDRCSSTIRRLATSSCV